MMELNFYYSYILVLLIKLGLRSEALHPRIPRAYAPKTFNIGGLCLLYSKRAESLD